MNNRGRVARTSIELAAVGGLTRGKTLRRRGLSHDNYANNRWKVWRYGKLFVSSRQITDIMSEDKVVESIKEVAKNVLPENARLLLYGSRARGNYSEGSDWD